MESSAVVHDESYFLRIPKQKQSKPTQTLKRDRSIDSDTEGSQPKRSRRGTHSYYDIRVHGCFMDYTLRVFFSPTQWLCVRVDEQGDFAGATMRFPRGIHATDTENLGWLDREYEVANNLQTKHLVGYNTRERTSIVLALAMLKGSENALASLGEIDLERHQAEITTYLNNSC